MQSRPATCAQNECYKRGMNKLSSVVVAIALAACGGGNKPVAPVAAPPAVPVAAAAPAGSIELGELKFYAGDDLGMQIHANGHFEVRVSKADPGKPAETSWQDVGSIAADGTISSSDGAKHGQVKPDGSFVGPEGQVAPFKLDGEALVVADKKITIDDKGILQGGNDMGKPMRIEGATTPGLKRTALIVLALLMGGPEDGHGGPDAPPAH
jgi:hypothetical protein